MSYVLNQYNHLREEDNKNIFLTLVTSGEAKRKKAKSDSETIGAGGVAFQDECVQIPGGLLKDTIYYFHGRIKRMSSVQIFDIKLVNYDDNNSNEQYIKTVAIIGGAETEWVNVDCIFTPAANFDTIVFELRRTREDFSDVQPRFPILIYEELSIVNNIITSQIGQGVALSKLGVQADPGLMMCINGEQIYVGRTGVYELRNGIIKATMFSVVRPVEEQPAAAGGVDIEELQQILSNMGADPVFTTSRCIFNAPKKRIIDRFTLDYMYERED